MSHENKSLQGVVRPEKHTTMDAQTDKKSENSSQIAKVQTGQDYDPPPMDVESQSQGSDSGE